MEAGLRAICRSEEKMTGKSPQIRCRISDQWVDRSFDVALCHVCEDLLLSRAIQKGQQAQGDCYTRKGLGLEGEQVDQKQY